MRRRITWAAVPPTGSGPPTVGTSNRWASYAFGLDLRGDFEAPGLGRDHAEAAGCPVVSASLVSAEEARAAWAAGEASALLNWRFDDGRTVMAIDRHPELGYRLFALEQGVYLVSADGSHIRCTPPGGETWIWQRYLVAQVLPLAAVINGYEVLHASAAVIDGQAVAFVAQSGVGKTSLALNLVLRGNQFLTDDVAAVSLRDGQPTIHPGPRLTNLRKDEDAVMGERRRNLGEVIGTDDEGLRLALADDAQSAPLRAMYFLERAGKGSEPQFKELSQISFADLVGSSFTRFVSTPARWRNQLEIFGAIAERVRIFRLSIPLPIGAAELSAQVESHVRDELV